jgi:hypothetical protein
MARDIPLRGTPVPSRIAFALGENMNRITRVIVGISLFLPFTMLAQAPNGAPAPAPAPARPGAPGQAGGPGAPGGERGPQPPLPFMIIRFDPSFDEIIAPDVKLDTIVTIPGLESEGPMWREGKLWFSDQRKQHRLRRRRLQERLLYVRTRYFPAAHVDLRIEADVREAVTMIRYHS